MTNGECLNTPLSAIGVYFYLMPTHMVSTTTVLLFSAWQYPHVNLFKVYGVGQWKKCSKEGDVSSVMVRVPIIRVYSDTVH